MKCHYCFGHGGTEHPDCDSENYGPEVECQMQNPTLPYFGDVCLVAHTGVIRDYSCNARFVNKNNHLFDKWRI